MRTGGFASGRSPAAGACPLPFSVTGGAAGAGAAAWTATGAAAGACAAAGTALRGRRFVEDWATP